LPDPARVYERAGKESKGDRGGGGPLQDPARHTPANRVSAQSGGQARYAHRGDAAGNRGTAFGQLRSTSGEGLRLRSVARFGLAAGRSEASVAGKRAAEPGGIAGRGLRFAGERRQALRSRNGGPALG